MDQNQTPKYATLLYDVRKQLDISFTEYVYLDMVHKLSYDRWCTKSLDNCAVDLGLSKRGVIKMKNRLIERGLLKKNSYGYLKVTEEYTGVAVNKVHPQTAGGVNKVHWGVNKVHRGGEQSAPKNNNEINKENNKGKMGKGYELAKQRAALLRLKALG